MEKRSSFLPWRSLSSSTPDIDSIIFEDSASVQFNDDGSYVALNSDTEQDFILARIESNNTQNAPWYSSLFKKAADPGEANDEWEFWANVMNNYKQVAVKQPKLLTKYLRMGIPTSIRGAIWQLLSNSKSKENEDTYKALLPRPSEFEKLIQRDLARTFPDHEYFKEGGPGQESLFNVLKVYSLFDPEVGYCQGIAFIAGPLLLNMPDEEAFSVLIRLMYSYQFRFLFTPAMPGLHLCLYQFDKLLKEYFPAIASHLEKEDVKSTMFVSQWFLTIFAYRFPIEIVFRILDIVFAEGIEVIFRFSFALLSKNCEAILSLSFEQLLEFLKIGLFDVYATKVDDLITDASNIKVSKHKFDKLKKEFDMITKLNDPEKLNFDALKLSFKDLQMNLRRLESSYEVLNREHIDLAKEFINLQHIHDALVIRHEEQGITLTGLRNVLSSERREAEAAVKNEMDLLAQKNLELVMENARLADDCEKKDVRIGKFEARIDELETKNAELENKWEALKKSLL